jgi:hypothetical protein
VRPIVELAGRTEGISLGKGLEQRVTTRATGEIASLARAVERLRVTIAKVLKRGAA